MRGAAACGTGTYTYAVLEVLPRTGDREPFVVEQSLDLKDRIDVFPAVKPMPAGALDRLKGWEFTLPEAQHEGLGGREAADFPDAKKRLLGERRCGLCG